MASHDGTLLVGVDIGLTSTGTQSLEHQDSAIDPSEAVAFAIKNSAMETTDPHIMAR
jgi:hypothetical protein